MKLEYKLNDTLNLRELIETIVEHVRTQGSTSSQPRTIVVFLKKTFKGVSIGGSSEEALVKTLQKILSGNLSYTKADPLVKRIESGDLDKVLLQNLSSITATVASLPGEDVLYRKLLGRVSLRFFSMREKADLCAQVERKDYAAFLLALLKHGFNQLYNLPYFYAERVYEEALTYDYDSRLRFALMREAALNGNKDAALEYGNYLAKTGPYEEAFEYLLVAAPLLPAVWNLAFMIEKQWVGTEQSRRFREMIRIEDKLYKGKEFSTIIDELAHLACHSTDPVRSQELLFSYRVYFYLAYRGFFKAYNSMAKLLENGTVWFSGADGADKTERLRVKYSRLAIGGCNVTAISNEGNRMLIHRTEANLCEPGSEEEEYMAELLSVAASMDLLHACFYLGNYYEYAASKGVAGITKKKIRETYERAASLDLDGSGMNGQLYLRLGKLAENTEDQIQYLEKALAAGLSDAAYSLALCYCDIFETDSRTRYLLKASKLLDDNMPYMSAECRDKTIALQRIISEML